MVDGTYLCRKNRKLKTLLWNRLLRSIDRDNAGASVDLRLHYNNILYWTSNNVVSAIDVVGSSRPQMASILTLNPDDRIEAVDFEINFIVVILHKSTKLEVLLYPLSNLKKNEDIESFELLKNAPDVPDFDEKKCTCLSVQVKYPICMTILSNNRGSFEYIGEKPYVLIVFTNLVTKECVRILKLGIYWLCANTKMSNFSLMQIFDGLNFSKT